MEANSGGHRQRALSFVETLSDLNWAVVFPSTQWLVGAQNGTRLWVLCGRTPACSSRCPCATVPKLVRFKHEIGHVSLMEALSERRRLSVNAVTGLFGCKGAAASGGSSSTSHCRMKDRSVLTRRSRIVEVVGRTGVTHARHGTSGAVGRSGSQRPRSSCAPPVERPMP